MPLTVPEADPCPFCENVAERTPPSGTRCAPVISDELAFSFVHPRQIQRGTLLVVPKRHAPTILDVTSEEAAAVMRMVHRLAGALARALEPTGLNLHQNNGVDAYQSVPHFHVHIVPRYPDDGGTYGEREQPERTPYEERAALAALLRAHLAD